MVEVITAAATIAVALKNRLGADARSNDIDADAFEQRNKKLDILPGRNHSELNKIQNHSLGFCLCQPYLVA